MKKYLVLFLLLVSFAALSQNRIKVDGKVYNTNNEPLIGANIQVKGTTLGSQTEIDGSYSLDLPRPSSDSLILTITHIGYVGEEIVITLNTQTSYIQNINLKEDIAILDAVDVKGERQREEVSVIKLQPKTIQTLPSPFNDFNKVLSTLPGVVSNNELSSTYSVRGGSFDENLVYVNDIPIYRPFLISNGQQEGLSFINTNMVSSVTFSAGGWQPKYGDKLSSVLNVTYKEPNEFGASAYISLLGGGGHIEGHTKNDRITYIAGVRHKSSQYLLNTLETNGQYLPKFTDFQGYTNFRLGSDKNPTKTTLGVLGSYARNRYLVRPEARETEFGTFTQALKLFVAFEGQELLEYDTYQGGLKLTHELSKNWNTSLIASGVYAREREFTDVEGGYRLCDVDKNVGSATFNECVITRGIGTSYDYGRNRLNAQIVTLENRNEIKLDNKNDLEFGFGYAYQEIDDELNEYNFTDSADYVTNISTLQSENEISSAYITGFVQNTTQLSRKITTTYGARLNYWTLNNQLLISPRAQISFQPDWVRDILFKGAIGMYQQPPFYRELRDFSGQVNKDLEAQQALHIIGGMDYNFRWWGRPFKFLGEIYYKKVYNVIPYDIDNVKVRYYANNDAEAYAAGLDLRVSGEFIEDTESWFSLGIINVREDVEGDGRGYIRRPTDQRVNIGVFFQDHLPNNPTFRVNLSLLFGSGLPFGPPDDFENRSIFNGDSYRRVDIGFSKQFYINKTKNDGEKWILLTAEILNLLGTSNPISFTWITDVTDTQIAVPNSLSARFLNVKLSVKI